jgi:hypothetical protein
MAKEQPREDIKSSGGDGNVRISGQVEFEALNNVPTDVRLEVYAFSPSGELFGSGGVDRKGSFGLDVPKVAVESLDLLIGKAGDPKQVRQSALYSHHYGQDDWINEGNRYLLEPRFFIAKLIWWPWWPKRICVDGHVYKTPGDCPVPFTKIEIFDVDREWCLWPILYPIKESLKNLRVKRLEELLRESIDTIVPVPEPWPFPGPGPAETPSIPMPPPKTLFSSHSISSFVKRSDLVELGPQPEPPDMPADERILLKAEAADISASTAIDQGVVADLSNLTITSKLPPWLVFKHCFYSKQLICSTNTDENGYFKCCFKWWPLHVRKGRLRFDWRPDIIIKVTQVIDGVEKVIYLDPYSSTRWNVTNATIDLYLDDPDIECGEAGDQGRPAGTSTFFTRIGNDDVYLIDQTGPTQGLYDNPPWSNMAYGKSLRIYAQFGDTISRATAIPGTTPPYHYRLSYSQDGIHFTPITTELKDTRVDKSTLYSEKVSLGPNPVGGEPALYQVRDFEDYYWYNPDWIGQWNTATEISEVIDKKVADGTYTLRLEVYDNTGTLLDTSKVDYRDGTTKPPAVLDPIYPCDMKITVDNNPPVVNMTVSPLPSECGVLKHTQVPPLDVTIDVNQANGRINSWGLYYVKGSNPTPHYLAKDESSAGFIPVPYTHTYNAATSMLAGVTGTCSFALRLWAWAHIRNGYSRVYFRDQIQSVVVENCDCP